MRRATLIGLLFLVIFSGCDQTSMMKAMTPPEDEKVAKGYINLLRQNKFEEIERDLDPSIKTANIHDVLVNMAELIPSQEPQSIKVVGVNTLSSSNSYKSNITFEYQFPNQWLLANVAIQKKGSVSTIVGFNVTHISDSLENLNKFTFSGKSALQYGVFALAILVPLFSLYVLILCIRTKIEKRKWLWIIFIMLGIGKFSVDWATGQWFFVPLAIQLLGAAAFAPPYGSWMLSVSLPLGAILFLFRRRHVSVA